MVAHSVADEPDQELRQLLDAWERLPKAIRIGLAATAVAAADVAPQPEP